MEGPEVGISRKIHPNDWQQMRGDEKEALIYDILGVKKEELAGLVADFEYEEGKRPNTLFVSIHTLAKMPVIVKKIMGLRVIPIDDPEGEFVLSLQDPWRWGNLFYQ
jgi:hypothetical protein